MRPGQKSLRLGKNKRKGEDLVEAELLLLATFGLDALGLWDVTYFL